MTPPTPEPPQVLGSLTSHGVTFLYAHRVLRDVARDLSRCISRPLSREVDIYVGVHTIRQPQETGRLRVGLQTEHILDRDGNRMWRFVKRRQRRVFAQSYDALLDLSPDNATAYDFLEADLRQKIQFGPHIFPDDDIEHEFVDAPPLFFGSLNDRRRGILDRLKSVRPLEIASHGTFGAGLDKLLATHGSVLNIHYQEAEYAEYPRFLKAYLAGKPFISEPLSAPLVAGLHYLELNEVATRERTEHVFGSIRTLASGYRLRNYLERVIQSHVAR